MRDEDVNMGKRYKAGDSTHGIQGVREPRGTGSGQSHCPYDVEACVSSS